MFLASLLAATPVLGQAPAWFADESAANVRAKWGIPEAEAVGFEVVCAEEGRVMVRPALFMVEERAEALRIRFEIDGDRYDRPARLAWSEPDGAFHAGAVVGRADPLIGALRRGSNVTYDFEPPVRDGDAFTVSLSGSAKVIDAALADCS